MDNINQANFFIHLMTIELDGIPIEIIRKPIKNMNLRIHPPDGRITVSAPLKLRLDLIRSQLETKRDWILRQRARIRATSITSPVNYETGEEHFFLGKGYSLLIHQTQNHQWVTLENERLHYFIRPDVTVVEKRLLLENWYREQMKALLPSLITQWEPVIGVSVAFFGIKLMKTRWGSCNPYKKRIWLNLNLIKKPLACLEYVLVHEMVHILEASHNHRFYAFMDKFLPEWRTIKGLL